jgi:hypothetical protein
MADCSDPVSVAPNFSSSNNDGKHISSDAKSYVLTSILASSAATHVIDTTALVIKNIPFHYASWEFMDNMLSLGLPNPWSFSYLRKRGSFKGTAFVNYCVASDAAHAFSVLNGMTISGRMLYVEYKTMPPVSLSAEATPFMPTAVAFPVVEPASPGSNSSSDISVFSWLSCTDEDENFPEELIEKVVKIIVDPAHRPGEICKDMFHIH